MAHLTVKSAYRKLEERINRAPQGAPPSKLLYEIYSMLFSEQEAEFVALMPIKPFDAEKAAKLWKQPLTQTQNMLDGLASRGLLMDIEDNGKSIYILPPPMAGFFEFSLMRIRSDIDQKKLSELFYKYITVEEDFIKDLMTGGETQLGRTFVNEKALPTDKGIHVLDHEKATHVIDTATHIGVGVCYCRHKMQHLGKACDAPMDICMTFNEVAESLTKHGVARAIDKSECHKLLEQAYEHNLVQFGDNARQDVAFICNCCGCCCEALIASRRFGVLMNVHTNFIPTLDTARCTGCGLCVEVCPVEALGLIDANDAHQPKKKKARLVESACLGCGVCVRNCPRNCLQLKERENKIITPLDGAHRAVLMAIERGKLPNLIFDNQALASHRAMAAILGVILKLPPLKQVLANKQVKSRYLEYLIAKLV